MKVKCGICGSEFESGEQVTNPRDLFVCSLCSAGMFKKPVVYMFESTEDENYTKITYENSSGDKQVRYIHKKKFEELFPNITTYMKRKEKTK